MRVSRNVTIVLVVSLFALAGASYFFMRSSNHIRDSHQITLDRLGKLRDLDGNFRMEAYRVKSALSPSYDTLTSSAENILNHCLSILSSGRDTIVGYYGEEFDTLLGGYCDHVANRVEMSEEFKSALSIVRNSERYLAELSLNRIFQSNTQHARAAGELLVATLSYLADSNVDTTKRLLQAIDRLSQFDRLKSPIAAVEKSLLFHSKAIATLMPRIRHLLAEIAESHAGQKMMSLEPAYLKSFAEAEARAEFFRTCLMLFTVALIFFTLFLLLQLWKAAQTLEANVEQRTSELNDTLIVVREQQASLVQSSKMSALGEMSGGIAHEINTPLAVVSLSLQNLRLIAPPQGPNADFISELYSNIERTTERIGKIINGLRKFSRDEKDEALTASRIVDIVADTCALCQERFAAHGVKVTVLPFNSEMQVHCRPVQISQVLLNLLNNSHDAILDQNERWIRIEVLEKEDGPEITVTDSGSGIAPEIQAKIMQPFFTTKPVGKGTGLGLSLSAGIMQAHGGSLKLDPQSAHTRFILKFRSPAESAVAA